MYKIGDNVEKKKHYRKNPPSGYKLRDALDQPTLDKLYGLKRRLSRGKLGKSNNKGDQSYVKGQKERS